MRITNEIVEERAKSLGFDLVGFAEAEVLEDEVIHLKEWIDKGYQAGMKYMERNSDKRMDIGLVFGEAKSVISLALNYYTPDKHSETKEEGKISRYAWGKDYHLVIWEKLKILEKKLRDIDPEFKSISYVDTGPVMDKVWAVKAGIGWPGKHTNVINPDIGSWFFIANIITNYEFRYADIITDHCGSCTACIDACPTGAIVNEYVLDSNRCISYLTIENKNEIPDTFKGKFDNWLFGCDICQDVCPWNIKFNIECSIEEFQPSSGKTGIPLKSISGLNEEAFNKRFESSPVKRAKLEGLKRNASFLLEEEKIYNSRS